MVEILALFAIAALGALLAVFRSRRRLLAGRYTRFAIFEHLVLPWIVFVMLGYAGYFFPAMLSLSGEEFVELAEYLLILGAGLSIIFSPLVIVLLVILIAPAYLALPLEPHIILLFVLKAVWWLLGASVLGNVIGYVLGGRQRSGLEGTEVA